MYMECLWRPYNSNLRSSIILSVDGCFRFLYLVDSNMVASIKVSIKCELTKIILYGDGYPGLECQGYKVKIFTAVYLIKCLNYLYSLNLKSYMITNMSKLTNKNTRNIIHLSHITAIPSIHKNLNNSRERNIKERLGWLNKN